MEINSKELLKRLGAGESISSLCRAKGISRGEFDRWWDAENQAPDPQAGGATANRREGRKPASPANRWGVPHILAENDEDLFFGFGYAMAQDRLFQLDYLRRKGHGRLAEILGEGRLAAGHGLHALSDLAESPPPSGNPRRPIHAYCCKVFPMALTPRLRSRETICRSSLHCWTTNRNNGCPLTAW